MSPRNHRRCALALIALVLMTPTAPAANVADLRGDWSNSANPNVTPHGTWAYTEGLNPLPPIASWAGAPGTPGWGPAANVGGNFLPFFYKNTPDTPFTGDALPGDITVHSTDNFNGSANGPAIITWTSAVSGTFTIHGMFWPVRMIDRLNLVELVLVHNGDSTPLGSGYLAENGDITRCTPLRFELPGVTIASGDILKLFIERISGAGDFACLSLKVSTDPCGSPPGDLNNTGAPDGADIAPFTNCLLNGVTNCGYCPCADMNGDNAVNATDVPLFVAALL